MSTQDPPPSLPERGPARGLGPARSGSEGGPTFEVVRAEGPLRRAALAQLLDRPADETVVIEFERQSAVEGTNLDRLWVTRDRASGRVGQSCLAIVNPGRTAVLLVSSGPIGSVGPWGGRGGSAATRGQRVALIEAACRELAAGGGVVLAQALMEPTEAHLIEAFLGAGFVRLADLAYMRRPLARGMSASVAGGPFPASVCVRSLAELARDETIGEDGAERLLREALEASYVGTLDCPALCGMRSLDDVIVSHRAVGEYDPGLWFLLLEGGRALGCVLLSPNAGPGTVELAYLGLAPAARGRGWASGLLRLGLAQLGSREEATIACAVDLRNHPALELYRRAGFKRFASRTAVVRSIGAQVA
ncbi:MAG: GNAT family N-acetyltransferase [Phycisphaerales bacterium]